MRNGLLTAEEFIAEWTPREQTEKPLACGTWDELSALAAEDIRTPPALVDGLMRRGEKVIIGGPSKSFKSFAALDLGIAVSTEKQWLGRTTSTGNVLVVNLELPRWCVRRRLIEIADARSVVIPSDRLFVWTLRGVNVTAEAVREGIRARRIEDLALVILDPVYRLLAGRDENSAGDIGTLLATLGGICADTGATLACPAHFAKGNAASKEAMDRVSGSGVFARDPDTLLTFTRHEEDDAFTVESVLRTFPPAEPFVVRWQYPLFRVDTSLDPERLRQPRRPGPTARATPDKLLAVLPPSGLTKPQWRKAADDQHGIGKTRFYELAAELGSAGRVRCEGERIMPVDFRQPHADD